MDTLLERDDDPVMLRQLSTRAKRIKGCKDEPTNASLESDTKDWTTRFGRSLHPTPLPPKPQKVLRPGLSSNLQRMAAELQKLNESGPVLPKDGAGQRMERSMELEKEAHDKLNVAEKAAFRTSWVESQTANYWETQTFTHSWREVSVEIGEYLSVNKIIQEEGRRA